MLPQTTVRKPHILLNYNLYKGHTMRTDWRQISYLYTPSPIRFTDVINIHISCHAICLHLSLLCIQIPHVASEPRQGPSGCVLSLLTILWSFSG